MQIGEQEFWRDLAETLQGRILPALSDLLNAAPSEPRDAALLELVHSVRCLFARSRRFPAQCRNFIALHRGSAWPSTLRHELLRGVSALEAIASRDLCKRLRRAEAEAQKLETLRALSGYRAIEDSRWLEHERN